MKRKKMPIHKLQIESFVTSLERKSKETLNGGQVYAEYSNNTGCHSCAESNCCDTEHRLCPDTQAILCTQFHTGCGADGPICVIHMGQSYAYC